MFKARKNEIGGDVESGCGNNMTKHIISISEMKVSHNAEDVLVTYSLGSCVGLSLYDPVACVGGLIHCMLPLSKVDPEKARTRPCMFTDTGVSLLLQAIFNLGAKRNRLVAKLAGASTLLDEKGLFQIGKRNYAIMRKVLWKNNILIAAEDVGGARTRTMLLYMRDGRTTIRSGGREVDL
ncbi:MAG: chemotaxis protein CheD [Planctomycetota bacterium]|jgi:chemotaxis protein CheD